MELRKLGEPLGAEVSGVDLSQPLAAETFAAIRQAWLEHLVIRLRDQKLSDPQLLAFDPRRDVQQRRPHAQGLHG